MLIHVGQLSKTRRKTDNPARSSKISCIILSTHPRVYSMADKHSHIPHSTFQIVAVSILPMHVWCHGKNHATLPFLVRQSVAVLIFAQSYFCLTFSLLCPSFLSNNIIFPLSFKFSLTSV